MLHHFLTCDSHSPPESSAPVRAHNHSRSDTATLSREPTPRPPTPSAIMASQPVIPSQDAYPAPLHNDLTLPNRPLVSSSNPNSYLGSGVPGSSVNHDQTQGAPVEHSLLAQSAQYEHEDLNQDHQPEPTAMDNGAAPELLRSASQMSQSQTQTPSRGSTLKKKSSLKRTGSLVRSTSRRSSRPGSVRSVTLGGKEKHGQSEENTSIFYCPVPTSGSPTELLSNRFQCKFLYLYLVQLHWPIYNPALIVL